MELLDRLGVDTGALPPWLSASLPLIIKWVGVFAAVLFVFLAGWAVKALIRVIGRRAHHGKSDFEGSSWDIGAVLAQFATIIMLAPFPLALGGVDAFSFFETYASGAIAAATTLLVAIALASWLAGSIRTFGEKAHRRTGADDTLFGFIASMVKYIVFAIAVVLALTQLGFDATSLVALVGAAGLAVGLALQDTLKSVAGGVMLAVFRPMRIGDWVNISGHEGEVFSITPFQTAIKQVDNRVVTITNDRVWGEPLVNYTRFPRRRLDLYFDISYDDDMNAALAILQETANAHDNVLMKETTWVGVHALADSSVQLRLRAWTPTPVFIQTRADLIQQIKTAFDTSGITIPYPHQVEIQYDGRSAKPETSAPARSPLPDASEGDADA